MPLDTLLTTRLGTAHPVLRAPMDGVADARLTAAVSAAGGLGASGAPMGTRFHATQEAAAAEATKDPIRTATGDDTLRSVVFDISRRNVWPAPFTGWCLRDAHADRWVGREVERVRHLKEEATRHAAARDDGDFDVAAVIAGESSGLVRGIPSAPAVVERLVGEA
jgi:nitronate monooxygenase